MDCPLAFQYCDQTIWTCRDRCLQVAKPTPSARVGAAARIIAAAVKCAMFASLIAPASSAATLTVAAVSAPPAPERTNIATLPLPFGSVRTSVCRPARWIQTARVGAATPAISVWRGSARSAGSAPAEGAVCLDDSACGCLSCVKSIQLGLDRGNCLRGCEVTQSCGDTAEQCLCLSLDPAVVGSCQSGGWACAQHGSLTEYFSAMVDNVCPPSLADARSGSVDLCRHNL